MKCPICGGPGVLLLLTVACDRCTSHEDRARAARGFIVNRGRPPGAHEYVFRSHECATTWRVAANLGCFPIVAIVMPFGARWRTSAGSVVGIQLTSELYEIYPTRVALDEARAAARAKGTTPSTHVAHLEGGAKR